MQKKIACAFLTLIVFIAPESVQSSEIGTNDFRISDMGPDGDPDFFATRLEIAYNSVDNLYLAVWKGKATDGEVEIYGQLIDGATGNEIGINDFRITDFGTEGDPRFVPGAPAVAHNPIDNEFLVVFEGEDDIPPLVDGEFEIFGQRLDGSTGIAIGPNDFRISDMGIDSPSGAQGIFPDVVHNPTTNEYLVVWAGQDPTLFEIFGQRLDASGNEIGPNDFPISQVGSGVAFFQAVTYNADENEYFVVWHGVDPSAPDLEIYGKRLDGTSAMTIGGNLRISDMGPDAQGGFGGARPDVAYNPIDREYLVVWYGDDNVPPLVDNELEIFGQRLDGATASEIGSNDFRISNMGPDGDTSFRAVDPSVAHDAVNNQYLVIWWAEDNTGALVDDENEIYGQILDASGNQIGVDDMRLSDMGPDGDPNYDGGGAHSNPPVVAFNPTNREYLVAWSGDDNISPLVDGEFEIFGQRVRPNPTLTISGTCPGNVTITIENATPNRRVFLAFANGTGSHSIGGGLCGSVTSGLDASIDIVPSSPNPRLADANGTVVFFANAPMGFCGVYLQAFDIRSCRFSNVVQL